MILILSEQLDYSTKAVMEWLYSWNQDVLRINTEDTIYIECVMINSEFQDFKLHCKNRTFKLSEITAYWYRRGSLTFNDLKVEVKGFPLLKKEFNHHLNNEIKLKNTFILD